jgi:hypothetical protein
MPSQVPPSLLDLDRVVADPERFEFFDEALRVLAIVELADPNVRHLASHPVERTVVPYPLTTARPGSGAVLVAYPDTGSVR